MEIGVQWTIFRLFLKQNLVTFLLSWPKYNSIQYGYIIEAAISYYPIGNGCKLWFGKKSLFYYISIQDWRSYDLHNLGLKIHNFSLELKQSKTPSAASCLIISTLVRRCVFFNPRCCKSWDCPNLITKLSIQNKSNRNFFVAFLFQAYKYLRSKFCSLYESNCIFDKFECYWNGNNTAIMTCFLFIIIDGATVHYSVATPITLELVKDAIILIQRTQLWPQLLVSLKKECNKSFDYFCFLMNV